MTWLIYDRQSIKRSKGLRKQLRNVEPSLNRLHELLMSHSKFLPSLLGGEGRGQEESDEVAGQEVAYAINIKGLCATQSLFCFSYIFNSVVCLLTVCCMLAAIVCAKDHVGSDYVC